MNEPSPKKWKQDQENDSSYYPEGTLPKCKLGFTCSVTDLIHYAEYSHPLKDIIKIVVEGHTEEIDFDIGKQSCSNVTENNNVEVKQNITEDAVNEDCNFETLKQYSGNIKSSEQEDLLLCVCPTESSVDAYKTDSENIISNKTSFAASTPDHSTQSINNEPNLLTVGKLGNINKEHGDEQISHVLVTGKSKTEEVNADQESDQEEDSYEPYNQEIGQEEEKDNPDNQESDKKEEKDKANNKESDEKGGKYESNNQESNQKEEKDQPNEQESDQKEEKDQPKEKTGSSDSDDTEGCELFDTQEIVMDYDEVDNIEEIDECCGKKLEKCDTVLTRGPSIVRSYSLLSDAERKDLIRRAFEFKANLQNELANINEMLRMRTTELEELRSRLDNKRMLVDGESVALRGQSLVLLPLFAERTYKEGSPAQIHFRLAESQFYRLLSNEMSSFKVHKVEYVVNPLLVSRFKDSRKKLEEQRNKESSLPVLGFHGTNVDHIFSICSEGFRVPGEADFRHASDPGLFGRGVYFSEYPSYSMPYIRGATKILLCQVLPGYVFQCKHVIHGEPLREGFDSHVSPNGKELVIFNSHHILPSYIVHYKRVEGDFHYEVDE